MLPPRVRAALGCSGDGFWARLERLDLRGGSGTSTDVVLGCDRLRWLSINQVRGLTDLGAVTTLGRLEYLSVYGLPQVSELPSLAGLGSLRFLSVGSMKGLRGLTGFLDAPVVEELELVRKVGLEPGGADRIATHPTLRAFRWYAEDVPLHVWTPVVERVGKPATTVDRLTWPLPGRDDGPLDVT